MSIETDILKEITKLAALFLPPDRIARIIEMDAEEFKQALIDPKSEIFRAYYVGFDKADVELRESVIKIAKQGSQPAQDQVKKYISELKAKLNE